MGFGPSRGSWYLSSKSDPRWDSNGRADIFSVFSMCSEAEQKLEELKRLFGEPPKDLEISQWKD